MNGTESRAKLRRRIERLEEQLSMTREALSRIRELGGLGSDPVRIRRIATEALEAKPPSSARS